MNYPWAVNILKLQRAYADSALKTEQDIKKLYVQYGGLIKNGYEENTIKAEPKEILNTPIQEDGVSVVEVIHKKRGRPSKKQD